jgi:hypothetical protein
MFRANGHDTTLLMMHAAWLTFVYLLDAGKGRKSLFSERLILPQRWYVDLGDVVGCVDNKVFMCVSMTMESGRFPGGDCRRWWGMRTKYGLRF